ncbi:MAG: DUF6491 family protein [Pseudomonadota bacterium]|nr:DUF6491 family protein [Pseudomonadota bacterium]
MRILPLSLLVGTVLLASCATTGPHMSDTDELALYTRHSEVVRKVTYREPIGWDDVGDSHVLLTIKPTEGWLFRLAPGCLDWSGSGPALTVSRMAGVISSGFDKVTRVGPGAPIACRIEEIRVVDLGAVRDERNAVAATP